jgi:tRNA(His) guanylyltransferase
MATPRKDALGDRMKRYEEVTRYTLPRRTYTIIRVDGRAFHSWTKGLEKPYDPNFMQLMDVAAIALCEQIAGAQFAYVQSDEISILTVDFLDIATEPWFDGAVQKFASIGASIATMSFNYGLMAMKGMDKTGNEMAITKKLPNAVFDARVFTIPDLIEVENYFVWRQQDAERNSVMMLARAYASHKQLAGKKRAEQHEIIHKAGDNWRSTRSCDPQAPRERMEPDSHHEREAVQLVRGSANARLHQRPRVHPWFDPCHLER